MNDALARTLLCRVVPYPYESLESLRVRTALANGYADSGVLDVLCRQLMPQSQRDTVHMPTCQETYAAIAHLLGIDDQVVYHACGQHFAPIIALPGSAVDVVQFSGGGSGVVIAPTVLYKHVRGMTVAQFCPRCLVGIPYHRVDWLPAATTACLQHYCLLVDRCAQCEQLIHIHDIVQDRCARCKMRLSTMTPINISHDSFGLYAQAVLQSWFASTATIPTPISEQLLQLSAATLYGLIDGLRCGISACGSDWTFMHGLEIGGTCVSFSGSSSTRRLPSNIAYCRYATSLKGVLQWPQGLYNLLDAYHSYVQRSGQQQNTPAPFSPAWVDRQWPSSAFDFVRTALRSYQRGREDSQRAMKQRRSVPQRSLPSRQIPAPQRCPKHESSEYFTVGHAARSLGTSRDAIQRLIGQQILVQERQSDGTAVVRSREVQAILQQLRGALSLEDVARHWGVSSSLVKELIVLGLLHHNHHALMVSLLLKKLHQPAVAEFLTSVAKHVKRTARCREVRVDLQTASTMVAAGGLSSAGLLKLVVDGHLPAYGTGEPWPISHLCFAEADLEQCLRRVQSSGPWMSIDELRCRMHVHDNVVDWVRMGLLIPIVQYGNIYYFRRDAGEQFLRTYMDVHEVARLLGLSRVDIIARIDEGRLRPIWGPGIEMHRQFLFRRSRLLKYYWWVDS